MVNKYKNNIESKGGKVGGNNNNNETVNKNKRNRRRGRRSGDGDEKVIAVETKSPKQQQTNTTTTTTTNGKQSVDKITSFQTTSSLLSDTQLQNQLLIRTNANEDDMDGTVEDTSSSVLWYKIGSSNPERDATLAKYNETATATTTNHNKKGDNTSSSKDAISKLVTPSMVAKYRATADAIYRRDVQLFTKENSEYGENGDDKWIESTMKRGTLKDRIAAMSVVVSTNPIHKLYALDGLFQMMGCHTRNTTTGSGNNIKSILGSKKSSHANSNTAANTNARVAQLAAEAVEDLFINVLLPPNRKLLTLAQRPLHLYEQTSAGSNVDDSEIAENTGEQKNKKNNKKNSNNNNSNTTTTKRTISPRILLLWRYEEMVKEKFESFVVQYLGRIMNESSIGGTIEQQKVAALRTASTLLRSTPECEGEILQLIVNKLGDPSRKVSAAAGHELRKVLTQHPVMITVIAREVQQLAHRPNLSNKALYNCIIFLNQLKLSPAMSKPSSTSSSTDKDNKNGAIVSKHKQQQQPKEPSLPASLISTYFRLFEVAVRQQDTNKVSKKPKKSDDKESTKSSSISDGMKGRLLSALLTGVNRAHPYLPDEDKDMDEHTDALYRVVHMAPPGACTQALLLLFHLTVGSDANTSTSNQPINKDIPSHQNSTPQAIARKERFYRALYSTLSQKDMLSSGKHLTMYFNLLYKSMRYETVLTRLVAFAKKLLSYTLHATAPIVAATIYLLNEVCKYHPKLLSCYEEMLNEKDSMRILDPAKREPRGALVLFDEANRTINYDDKKEDTNMKASAWELSLVKYHYHPSVQLFASSIGGELNYSGDPIKDFALGPFLDKFAYRNPKSVERVAAKFKRGESIAERKSGTDSIIEAKFQLPVNDPDFLSRPDLPVQDEFFHKYFQERAIRDPSKLTKAKKDTDSSIDNKKRKRRNGDDDDISDDDDEGEIDALYNEEDDQIDIDGKEPTFDWDTDSDEERFVDQLAERMFEDASGDYGPADLDDEDPDMDDWDDIRPNDPSDEENMDDDDDESDNELIYRSRQSNSKKVSRDDASASDSSTSDNSDTNEINNDDFSDDDADAFMDQNDDDSSDDEPDFLEDE